MADFTNFKGYKRIVETSLSPSEAHDKIIEKGKSCDCSDRSCFHVWHWKLSGRDESFALSVGAQYDVTRHYEGRDPKKIALLWFIPKYPVQTNLLFEIYDRPEGGSIIYCWSMGDEYKGSMLSKVDAKATEILSAIPKLKDERDTPSAVTGTGLSSSGLIAICLAIGFFTALLSTCS